MCKERLFTGKIVGSGFKRLLMLCECSCANSSINSTLIIVFETLDDIIVFFSEVFFCRGEMCKENLLFVACRGNGVWLLFPTFLFS